MDSVTGEGILYPNGSDVCKAIAAFHNLKHLTPAFTFALKPVNDTKKQDVYMRGSFTVAGAVVVRGAALFAFHATVARLLTGATVKGATATAARLGIAGNVNRVSVTACCRRCHRRRRCYFYNKEVACCRNNSCLWHVFQVLARTCGDCGRVVYVVVVL
jgi:hypothetical protein